VIVARLNGETDARHAAAWLEALGPVRPPGPGPDGVILGPERVRVKLTRSQQPLRFGGELAGWVELYDDASNGTLRLDGEGLLFRAGRRAELRWTTADITGIQPASSSIQLGLHDGMASIKFLDGSVRLWTRAISDVVREHHRLAGHEVTELQPFVRTREIARNAP
jgi:hypothetical protein